MEKNMTNKYWQDVEKKELSFEELKSEFGEGELNFDIGSVKKNRRNFLKVLGFSFSAAPMVSCIRIPVKKALPYVEKSYQVTPGVANWYATSMDPLRGAALLVKTREGRPIKIEGNPISPISKGGTMATDQASVLSLYDSNRYKYPQIESKQVTWSEIDKELINKLEEVDQSEKEIVLLTQSISSPSTLKIIKLFSKKYKNFKHIVFDPSIKNSILEANLESFKTKVFPKYEFDKAKVIVSFSADFLGTWLSPVEHTKGYTSGRDLLKHNKISKHIQFESIMTLTGSNADLRVTISPKEEENLIINLLAYLQKKTGQVYLPMGQKLPSTNLKLIEEVASQLLENKKESLVVSGSNNKDIQVLINAINHLLGNYNNTITVYQNDYFVGSNDKEMEDLVGRLDSGRIGAILFLDCNPAYSYYDSSLFIKKIKNIDIRISFAKSPDETSSLCNYILPSNHYLESWNDYFQVPNVFTIAQPVMNPIFSTRTSQESLLALLEFKADYYNFIKKNATQNFFKKQNKYLTRVDFWNHTVHDGVVLFSDNNSKVNDFVKESVLKAFDKIKRLPSSYNTTLKIYKKVGMLDGEMINNPWLLEMPDPITKVTWENYFMISPATAKKKNLKTSDVIEVSFGEKKLTLPIVVQPGVNENVIGLALGFGRKVSGKAGKNIGGNAYPFSNFLGSNYRLETHNISFKNTGTKSPLALTQTHHSMEGRDIVRETTLKEWTVNNNAGNEEHIKLVSMWNGHDKSGEQWAMAIDLNKCTGCSGCIVSCNAENNVPVVGKEEVLNRREMHWMRIDRYFSGDDNNPEVVHQPVMCQHCDNAPCETVCPVLATLQSSDGLNQQVYNRCVGTRYCANNCPYKVRRFNWFDYPHNDKVENMVLNPDVTVRTRGVMEKCSMCIQRIQEGRLVAKKEGRETQDKDIKLACQQSCPGDAIVFGNLNNPKSDISKLLKNARNYKLLEELNVAPRVSYLTKVRNKD